MAMTTLEQLIRRKFEEQVEQGVVIVAVDPRGPAVVPDRFSGQKVLSLQFSPRFREVGPLVVTDEGVRQDLHFPATPAAPGLNFVCVVPWRAVFALRGPSAELTFPSQLPCDLDDVEPETVASPAKGLKLVK